MENKHQQPHHWRSCKLMIDPVLSNGFFKVYRYDGQHFNMPVQDLGVFVVDKVRDPRICRLWTKYDEIDLLVPKFKVDECYVGPVPPKEVTFARLNDNVREDFLTDLCKKYGQIEEVDILYNPQNKKHLGIAKVIFDTVKAAKEAVQHLHQTSVMGNIIHVELDPRGDNRMRYFHLLINGHFTPQTVPVGINDVTLQYLADRFLGTKTTLRHEDQISAFTGCISSPTSIATPLSLDTAYSSIWQDTPGSLGQTPQSQGTPRTPHLFGTPLSQDSCYSSQQNTPVYQASQGDHSSYSVHRRSRTEGPSGSCRHPGRYQGRYHRSSQLSSLFQLLQPPPPLPLQSQIHDATDSHRASLPWSQNSHPGQETLSLLPLPHHESPMAFSLGRSPAGISNLAPTPVGQRTKTPTLEHHICMADSPPSPPDTSGTAVQEMQSHSLDTRIEMLLSKNQSSGASLLDDGDLTMAECPAESHVSRPFSLDGTPGISRPLFDGNPHTSRNLEDSSETPLPDEEEKQAAVEERFTETPHASRNIPLTLNIRDQTIQSTADQTDVKTRLLPPSWTQVLPLSEDFHLSAPQPLTSYFSGDIPNPVSNPKASALPANGHTGIMPFNPPILPPRNLPPVPPPILPFPVPLSDGTIPIPPPGFVPVPGQGFPLPPPPLLPPSAVLGPPPPLVAPPPIPPLAYPYPITNQQSDKVVYPPQMSMLVPFSAPPWPPRFDPSVPPPGYLPPRKDSHKVTVDKVISVIIDELKSIMRKDITRKMVEGVAFRAFDEWWENQEQKAKTAVMPGKGEERAEGRTHPKDPLTLISGLRKTVQLPSFKVKKKRLGDTGEDPKPEVGLSAPEWDGHGVTGETQEGGVVGVTPDEASLSRGSSSAIKRRHARPLELDSEGEEEEEEEEEEQREDNNAGVAVSPDSSEPSEEANDEDQNQDNRLDDDELEATGEELSTEDNKRSSSELESSSSSTFSSEDSESFSDSSESFSSEYSDESPVSTDEEDQESDDDEEEESTQERAWEHSRVECVVISSDEEMELDAPPTPTAPLTPGTELEVGLAQLDGSHEAVERDLVEALLGDTNSLFLADPMVGHLSGEHQHPLQSPCPVGIPVACSDSEVEPDSPVWEMESPDTLRPLTPTGSLVDSDPEVLFKSKPTPPAAVEVELPHTPGRGVTSSLDSEEDFMDQLLYLSNTDPKERAVAVSYAPYEDMPRTPGAEERSVWNRHNSIHVPKTPGRETTPSEGSLVMSPPPPLPRSPFYLPSLSSCLYTPRTPGRDITPPRKPHRHLRTLDTPTTGPSSRSHTPALSSLVYEERLTASPVVSPPPCSLSSADSPGSGNAWLGPGARGQIPLQGLENRPGLVDDREKGKLFWRRIRQRRRQKRRRWKRMQRWGRTWSPPRETSSLCPALSLHRRSPGGEREVLHRVWREGLDEEDCRLLQDAYERQLQHDNVPWLNDTRWVPHPLTRVLTEEVEEGCDWLRNHVTGSARSEGFYKIDKKDKIDYLNRTRLATPSRPTNTQPQALLRSGSDFRSEQRRLLASFSCDSDLVKFNQLKFRKKKIRFCRSHIHDWGLFALEPIAADEMVIEYVGQTIRQLIADMREKRYEDEGIGSSYLFRVDEDYILDATKCGNLARFINHSCNPNCYAKIITVDSQKKIVIYSRQPISINEEITYDYKFPIEDEKIPCLCEAENCRGSLN